VVFLEMRGIEALTQQKLPCPQGYSALSGRQVDIEWEMSREI